MHLYEGRADRFRVDTVVAGPFNADVYLRAKPGNSTDISLPRSTDGSSLELEYNPQHLKPESALQSLIQRLTPELSAYFYAEYCDQRVRTKGRSLQRKAKKLLDDSVGISVFDGYRTRLSSLEDLNDVMSEAGEVRILAAQVRDWLTTNTMPAISASPYKISQDHLARIQQRDATIEIEYADRAVEHLDNQRRIDYQVTIAGTITLLAAILTLVDPLPDFASPCGAARTSSSNCDEPSSAAPALAPGPARDSSRVCGCPRTEPPQQPQPAGPAGRQAGRTGSTPAVDGPDLVAAGGEHGTDSSVQTYDERIKTTHQRAPFGGTKDAERIVAIDVTGLPITGLVVPPPCT